MILLGIGIGGDLGIYTMLTLYLETERGLPPELAITLLGLCRIAGLFMTFVAGWVTDRIGEKRAIALFLSCAGIAAIVLGSLPSPWVVVLVFVQPALAACFFPAGFSAMSKIVQPTLRSMSVSLVGAGGFLIGAGIVPTFLGFMGDNFSFSTGIIVMGCVMFLGPVLAFRLKFVEHEEEGC